MTLSDPNGQRPPLYALVIYLPDPLCAYLDDLRRELIPGCNPHAHVSVLPPRTITVTAEEAIAHARGILAAFPPLDIELGEIEKFDQTDVIFISVTRGAEQLAEMHHGLNTGLLAFDEPFTYHPHITLAQEIPPGRVAALRDLALKRWSEFPGPRTFRADHTVFVRNTRGNFWVDLAESPLQAAVR